MMIVMTDHAGIPDIVKDGENGIVVSKKTDVHIIYDGLSHLNYGKTVRINRQDVQALYTEQLYLQNMHNLFELCMRERKSQ